MSNQAWPWPFVDYLVQCFGLNDCEAADLSDRTRQCLDYGMSRALMEEALWMRVDVLINKGSPMQATWDMVKTRR